MSVAEQDLSTQSPSGDSDAYSIDTGNLESGGGLEGVKTGPARKNKLIVVMLAVVLAAVLVFGYLKLTGSKGTSGKSSQKTSTLTHPTGNTVAGQTQNSSGSFGSGSAGSESASGGSQSSSLPVVPYQVYTSRDPFSPVALPVLSGDGPLFGQTLALTPTTQPSTGTSQVTSTTSGSSSSSTTSTTSAAAPQGPPPSTTHTIELISIFTSDGQPTANVTVDSQGYQVYDGEVFDGNFTVVTLSVATGCGTFLYADYEFQLCEGQQAQV